MLLVMYVLAFSGCGPGGGESEDPTSTTEEGTATAEPSATATEAAPETSTPTEEPTATEDASPTEEESTLSDDGADALAFVERLIEAVEEEDWETVRDSMREDIKADFDDSDVDLETIARSNNIFRELSLDPYSELQVEERDHRPDEMIVRSVEYPSYVVTLEREDGDWTYVPGANTLFLMELMKEYGAGNLPSLRGGNEDYNAVIDGDIEYQVQREVITVYDLIDFDPTRDDPRFIVRWTFVHDASAELALDSLFWSLGDDEGEAELVGTTAFWEEEDHISLPTAPLFADEEDALARMLETSYILAFQLNDVPSDWDEGLELHVDGLEVDGTRASEELDVTYWFTNKELPVVVE
ncbi:MAG: hypothetical protein ACOC9Y_04010, partial [Chloroflexota bacterium]